MCVFYFVFVRKACLPAAPADTTATEILNPDSGSFNYSYCYCGALAHRERGRGMEEEGGGEGREGGKGRNRVKRRRVLVFPKKGSFRDGICMGTQWQHLLCSTLVLLRLPLITSPISCYFLPLCLLSASLCSI